MLVLDLPYRMWERRVCLSVQTYCVLARILISLCLYALLLFPSFINDNVY
jgi:hypothetical protein